MPKLTLGTIRRLTSHLPDDAPVFPSWDPDASEDAPQVELLGFGVRSRTPKDPVGLSVVLSVPGPDDDEGTADEDTGPEGESAPLAIGDRVFVPCLIYRKDDPAVLLVRVRLDNHPAASLTTDAHVRIFCCRDMQGRYIGDASCGNSTLPHGFVGGEVVKSLEEGRVGVRIYGINRDFTVTMPAEMVLRSLDLDPAPGGADSRDNWSGYR